MLGTKKVRFMLAGAAAAAPALGIINLAFGDTPISSFTPGDLVVIRTGDATHPDTPTTTTEVGVYLDEYTTAGAYVGTVAVDQSGDANTLTLPGVGSFQHEGLLSDSVNGALLSFAGYNSAAGSADANTIASVGKRIGIVGVSASSLDTSTVVNSYGTGSSNPIIRGATTIDGTGFWTNGKYAASGASSNGGLAYVSGTGPTATTTTVEGFADWRDIVVANGQLYGGTGSSSVGNHGPYQISTGLPTTNLGTSLSLNTQLGNYSGGMSASSLALLNIAADPNNQNGVNVMYTIGDQSTPGIVKYYYNGTTWVNGTNLGLNSANNVLNPVGLAATIDPSNPNWVDLTVSGTNGVYTYVDQTGYNGTLPSSGGYVGFTDLITPSANEQFRGVAIAVPEPATLGLFGLGTMGLLARRSRRRVA